MGGTADRKYWGFLLVTLGAAFAASGLTFWFAWGLPEASAANQVVLGIVVHVLFGYIVVMTGITIYRSDLEVGEGLIAAKWCFAGLVFMAALVGWARLPNLSSGGFSLTFFYELVVVGSVGAAAGSLIGLNRGQAVQNQRLVEQKDDQQETLVFLLQLLRHDIQNDLTAITGYTDLLTKHGDPDSAVASNGGADYVDRIEDRTRAIKRLLQTAGTVIESETGGQDLEVVDLTDVLRRQVETLDSAHESVVVETEIEEGLRVEADRLVDELFRNVLDNAVTHNPTESLLVSVTARVVDDEIEVVIADDGEGIPESIRLELFDPGVQGGGSDGDGLGLYLVRKLVESYDGSIAVESGSSGTEFTIRLPEA